MQSPLRCLLVPLLMACDGGAATEPAPTPAVLERISRQHQNGVVGLELDEPLVVRVLDSDREPIVATLVTWSIGSGSGTLTSAVTRSDDAGFAWARWRLPAKVGMYRVTAAVPDRPPVIFSAAALAAPGADRGGPRLDLATFAFLPDTVSRSASPPSTVVRLRITDDFSGVEEAAVMLVSPSGAPHVRTVFRRVSGDDRDGTYHASIEFDRGVEAGEWFVFFMSVRDRLGQEEHYDRKTFARFPLRVGP